MDFQSPARTTGSGTTLYRIVCGFIDEKIVNYCYNLLRVRPYILQDLIFKVSFFYQLCIKYRGIPAIQGNWLVNSLKTSLPCLNWTILEFWSVMRLALWGHWPYFRGDANSTAFGEMFCRYCERRRSLEKNVCDKRSFTNGLRGIIYSDREFWIQREWDYLTRVGVWYGQPKLAERVPELSLNCHELLIQTTRKDTKSYLDETLNF